MRSGCFASTFSSALPLSALPELPLARLNNLVAILFGLPLLALLGAVFFADQFLSQGQPLKASLIIAVGMIGAFFLASGLARGVANVTNLGLKEPSRGPTK